MLYPKQKECLDLIIKTMKKDSHISQKHLYLSGEMGSGKTYIATSVLKKMNAKKALVACPATVVEKWSKVYREMTASDKENVAIYKPNQNILQTALNNPKIKLIIIAQKQLTKAFTELADQAIPQRYNIDFKKDIIASISNTLYRVAHKNDDIHSNIDLPQNMTYSFEHLSAFLKYAPEINNIDFLIFDEVHGYVPGHQDFSMLHLLMLITHIPALFLTGTLFNQNLTYLYILLCSTNPALIEALSSSYPKISDLSNFGFFDANIWRKIAVKINLGEVKKNADLKQKIMPLKPLTLTPVQKAWLNVANINLKAVNPYATASNIDQKTTAYLDLPSQEQPEVTRTVSYRKLNYQIAMALFPLKPEKTAKFIELQKILNKAGKEKTIIFAQSPKLIKNLAQLLPNSFALPNSIVKSKREKYIDDKFNKENKQIGIMLPKRISVGIDIRNVENIVWYQVPDNVAEILQAQRRIMRLDSDKSSKIFFLYYADTFQESIIKQVSQSAVHNAANYSVRDTSNLAKMTHILFEGFGKNED